MVKAMCDSGIKYLSTALYRDAAVPMVWDRQLP